ncbi:hypothetical protein [Nocardioides sp.]|uniref:hypothetical protein n=1 Tax=Nocardioides sp. TaxID=35761 RepID=UPI0039E45716
MTETLVLRWTPRPGDYVSAVVARRGARGARWRDRILGSVLMLVGLIALRAGLWPVAVVVAAPAVLVWLPVFSRIQAGMLVRPMWKANPHLADPVELAGWTESSDVMVIDLSKERGGALMVIATRGAAGPVDLDRFRAILRERIGTPR